MLFIRFYSYILYYNLSKTIMNIFPVILDKLNWNLVML